MQLISAKPLIEKFRNSTFKDVEVGPYFMAYMIFMAIAMTIASGDSSLWYTFSGIASLVITIFGVLHLKKQNGDTYGDLFLAKYFCLGWIVTVRMILLSVPSAVLFFALASIIGGKNAIEPAGAIFTIVFEILFYWWLGSLIAKSIPRSANQSLE